MNFAGKNIRFIRKHQKWTQDEFAEKIGIKRSLLGAYEEGRAEPKLEVIKKVSRLFDLSFEDLLLKDMQEVQVVPANFLQALREKKLSPSTSRQILFVPIKASAGYLNGYADSEFLDELNTFTLPMIAPGNFRAFEIQGDSMLPTPSGSVVVGEKIEKLDEIKSSNTYVLLSKYDGVVYKRVQTGKTQKEVTLISDNPSYRPYSVKCEDILEVWKAIYIIQKADTEYYSSFSQLNVKLDMLTQQVSTLQSKLV